MTEYEKVKARMLRFMEGVDYVRLFGGRAEDVKRKLKTLFDCVEEGAKPGYLEMIVHLLRVVQEAAVSQVLQKASIQFLLDMVLFLRNFNENYFKKQEIETQTEFITRALQGFLTMLDAIKIMRMQISIMRKWQAFEPPAFKLSRLYLEGLKEE